MMTQLESKHVALNIQKYLMKFVVFDCCIVYPYMYSLIFKAH